MIPLDDNGARLFLTVLFVWGKYYFPLRGNNTKHTRQMRISWIYRLAHHIGIRMEIASLFGRGFAGLGYGLKPDVGHNNPRGPLGNWSSGGLFGWLSLINLCITQPYLLIVYFLLGFSVLYQPGCRTCGHVSSSTPLRDQQLGLSVHQFTYRINAMHL